uniref:Uncharacterized protein n=1 Tax=Nelumbo nucifera TaxID=4432 RepID=A0A822Z3F4_NELNU|nr:TPA_asm: hypothetical protein HUJ06_008156 [Nelumbo nucifera]
MRKQTNSLIEYSTINQNGALISHKYLVYNFKGIIINRKYKDFQKKSNYLLQGIWVLEISFDQHLKKNQDIAFSY